MLPPANPTRPRRCRSIWCSGARESTWRCARSSGASFGWKRYRRRRAQEICRQVVDDCWTGEFFAGSDGHFKQFWTRDLAMCTPALCRLGPSRQGRAVAGLGARAVREGRAHHDHHLQPAVPARRLRLRQRFAADAALRAARGRRHPPDRPAPRAADARDRPLREDGLRSRAGDGPHGRLLLGPARLHDRTLDGLREHDDRACSSGCSTSTTACRTRWPATTWPSLLVRHYWMGDYFRDSLCRDEPSGDANVWPFFFEIVTDTEMQRRAFATLEARGFTQPVPLRYFETAPPGGRAARPAVLHARTTRAIRAGRSSARPISTSWPRSIGPRWSANAPRWPRSSSAIGNYLELYTTDAKPYRGRALLYYADQGMIWAAMFLDLYA